MLISVRNVEYLLKADFPKSREGCLVTVEDGILFCSEGSKPQKEDQKENSIASVILRHFSTAHAA
jgi:hypothetical protein